MTTLKYLRDRVAWLEGELSAATFYERRVELRARLQEVRGVQAIVLARSQKDRPGDARADTSGRASQ